MNARRAGLTAALTALALLATTAGATTATAGPGQAGPTDVEDVRIYAVHGEVSVDVTVRQPDARAGDPPGRATNRGAVAVALATPEGEPLAALRDVTRLPVSVPRSRFVRQTYRFDLAEGAARAALAAGRIEVAVDVQTRLDLDGAGPRDPSVSDDDRAETVDVERLRQDPPRWQFFFTAFDTSIACDLYDRRGDDCRISYDGRATPPFTGDGRLKLWRNALGQQVVELDTSRGSAPEWFRGTTQVGFGSAALVGTTGKISMWGAEWAGTGTEESGRPGQPGGPLYLDIHGSAAHDWGIWGYLDCRPGTCAIPQR